ncbi:MAG: hypothetical protein FWE61_09695, partial [Micrococcales bacterium]|nr:hypothetical protein [Micrococcales bacterium]
LGAVARQMYPDDAAFFDAAFCVCAERGPSFARALIAQVCRPGVRAGEHYATAFSSVAVRLAHHHQFVPDDLEYLKDWVVHAQAVICDKPPELLRRQLWGNPTLAEPVIRERFADHVRAGAAARLAGTGPFGAVLPAGVAKGWLDRDEAVELVFAMADAATRPGDRKVWVGVLDDLDVADAEILARAQTLVPLLANAAPAVVERLAPVLIGGVDGDLLADVATAALSVATKKARLVVLAALAARPRPSPQTVEVLAPQVTALDVGRDAAVVRAAQALVTAWGLATGRPAPHVAGLWRPVPPVWTVPRFDHGDATPEALTQVMAQVATTGDDLGVERFLALANAVACHDVGLVRTALVGLRDAMDISGRLSHARLWMAGDLDTQLDGTRLVRGEPVARVADPYDARGFAVFQRLGQVPCLLSEPSTVDLRVNPADLLARLRVYDQAGASASEADLLLALTRLDVAAVDEQVRAAVQWLTVPVVLPSGEPMPTTAGPAVAVYLDDPAVAVQVFPPRLREPLSTPVVFPCAEPSFDPVWSSSSNTGAGERSAVPLPPAVVAGVVAGVLGGVDAVTAWERGLLRPGAPGVRYVDWHDVPYGLGAMARAAAELARQGLLAVAWQVLDDLAGVAAAGPRVPTRSVDVAEALAALLPEVVHAVDHGLADPAVLDLPGTRALAARAGSSHAVTTARQLLVGLPGPTRPADCTADGADD